MLRRAALAVAGGGGVAGAYGYKWANDNLGSDALDRIIQVCACLHATLLQIHDAAPAAHHSSTRWHCRPSSTTRSPRRAVRSCPSCCRNSSPRCPKSIGRYANPNPDRTPTRTPTPTRCPRPSSCGAMRCCTRSISSRSSISSCSLAVRRTPPARAPASVSQPEWYARRRLLLQERPEDRLEHGRRGAQGVHRSVPALLERHPSSPGG